MSSLPAIYVWDNEFFTKRTSQIRKASLGLIALALFLMLLDLSRAWILAPLLVVFIGINYFQRRYDKAIKVYRDSSIAFAPRSFVVYFPTQSKETRYSFHQVVDITPFIKLGYDGIRLTLKQESGSAESTQVLELYGYGKTPQLLQRFYHSLESLDIHRGSDDAKQSVIKQAG